MYNNYWKKLENTKKYPKFIRSVKIIDVKDFFKLVEKNSETELKKIINNLYQGDFYIFRGAIKKKFISNIKLHLKNFSVKNKSSFHKMRENCPNFWRKVDERC